MLRDQPWYRPLDDKLIPSPRKRIESLKKLQEGYFTSEGWKIPERPSERRSGNVLSFLFRPA